MDAHKTSLNVRDALSYLDRVKYTFADQTQVYDRFLTRVWARSLHHHDHHPHASELTHAYLPPRTTGS